MPRLLPLLALAQIAGIALAVHAWVGPGVALAVGVVALGAGLANRRIAVRTALVLLLFAAVGALSLGQRLQRARAARPLRAFHASVEASVCGTAQGRDWLAIELCEVEGIDSPLPSLRPPARVRVSGGRASASGAWLATLRTGQRIRARLRLGPPRPLRNPGARTWARSLERRGVGAVAHLADPALAVRVSSRDRWSVYAEVEPTRRAVAMRLSKAAQRFVISLVHCRNKDNRDVAR